jgi:hypothetical protein
LFSGNHALEEGMVLSMIGTMVIDIAGDILHSLYTKTNALVALDKVVDAYYTKQFPGMFIRLTNILDTIVSH